MDPFLAVLSYSLVQLCLSSSGYALLLQWAPSQPLLPSPPTPPSSLGITSPVMHHSGEGGKATTTHPAASSTVPPPPFPSLSSLSSHCCSHCCFSAPFFLIQGSQNSSSSSSCSNVLWRVHSALLTSSFFLSFCTTRALS